jgi:isopentenyl-diphosphate delta-isomerase
LLAVNVAAPVPPLPTGSVPVTLVAKSTKVVDVEPVPPLAIGRVPLTWVAKPILPQLGAAATPPEISALPTATSASCANECVCVALFFSWFHLAVSIFVFCGLNLLIQKRAVSKYHCGGLWANTCCTHPHWNEAPEESARRRLYEELGLKLDLQPARVVEYYAEVSNNLIEHERVQVYFADVASQNLSFDLAPEEVAEVRWVDVRELKADAAANPELYAPWFKIYLARWDELGL